MSKSEDKKDPLVKVRFHYASGDSFAVPIYDSRCVQDHSSEIVKEYNEFSRKVEKLYGEAMELNEKGLLQVEFTIAISKRKTE